MDTSTIKRTRWFWPWQDEKEESWLEQMSMEGWHLKSVQLPCMYTFTRGEPHQYVYRLDYMPLNNAEKLRDYQQIFTDVGWEYLGEMSNWRYWRIRGFNSKAPEIFTDRDSKIRKYQRLLGYMAFFLFFLVFLALSIFSRQTSIEHLNLVNAIYLFAKMCYIIVISIYVVVVIQLTRRISQLKQEKL